MALAIVPPNSKPGVQHPEFDGPDDFTALVHELIIDEDLTELEASSQALALIDDLSAYASGWDADSYLAGHPDGAPLLAPPTAIELAPSQSRHSVLIE